MARKINVDLEELEKAVVAYETIIDLFEDSIKDTEKAIQSLKNSGWKSGASAAYFMTYNDKWKKNMQQRLNIIKHLKNCLVTAEINYSNLYEAMRELPDAL